MDWRGSFKKFKNWKIPTQHTNASLALLVDTSWLALVFSSWWLRKTHSILFNTPGNFQWPENSKGYIENVSILKNPVKFFYTELSEVYFWSWCLNNEQKSPRDKKWDKAKYKPKNQVTHDIFVMKSVKQPDI